MPQLNIEEIARKFPRHWEMVITDPHLLSQEQQEKQREKQQLTRKRNSTKTTISQLSKSSSTDTLHETLRYLSV